MATLQELSKVIMDLFEQQGASSIEVTSGNNSIKMSRKEYEQAVGYNIPQQNQIVQVINSISININIDNKTIIKQVLDNIRNKESDQRRINEAEKKLDLLLKETLKQKPKWKNVKDILKWALNFGKEVFIQLIPVLLQMRRNL